MQCLREYGLRILLRIARRLRILLRIARRLRIRRLYRQQWEGRLWSAQECLSSLLQLRKLEYESEFSVLYRPVRALRGMHEMLLSRLAVAMAALHAHGRGRRADLRRLRVCV